MQIDWMTVGFQWINFLILMWLLRRFLYQPIIRAMDSRQQAIADRSREARQKAEQAEQLAQEYRDRIAELDRQRSELIDTARAEAASERDKLLQQARAEAQDQAARWHLDIEREKAEFQNQLSREFGHLITATAGKVLRGFSGQAWEYAVFDQFLRRLNQLPEPQKKQLAASSNDGLMMASSFELDTDMRQRLQGALSQALARGAEIRFEVLSDNQCGLRLSSSDFSVEWTLDSYFASLDNELDALLARLSPAALDPSGRPGVQKQEIAVAADSVSPTCNTETE